MSMNNNTTNSTTNNSSDPQQQMSPQQGQQMQANMAAFGYPAAANQEALMHMLRGGASPGGFPHQAGGAPQFDANGQPVDPNGGGQTPQDMQQQQQAAMMAAQGQQMAGYAMFDPSQMQQMAGFGGFPGMAAAQGGFAMDPSAGMNAMYFPGMQQPQQAQNPGADGQNMTQAQAATMNSSAALAQASGAMNPQQAAAMQQGMAGQAAAMNQQGMMNPAMMGDPSMFIRQMMQQQAGGHFFGGQPQGQFGLGAGLSGAAGITAASYLNMASQGGMGAGADMQQSMMMGGGAGGGAVLNPFARPDKKVKNRKNKDKPKRPLSAYNIFFKDERGRILKEIEEEKNKTEKKEGEEDDAAEDKGSDSKEEEKTEETKGGDDAKKEEKVDASEKKEGEDKVKKEDGEEKSDAKGEDDDAKKKEDKDDGKGGKKRKRVPHGKIGFESLAKMIGRRWKELPPEDLEQYKKLAEVDMKRYRKEMEGYLQKQRLGLEQSREHLESMVDDDTKKRYFGEGEQSG